MARARKQRRRPTPDEAKKDRPSGKAAPKGGDSHPERYVLPSFLAVSALVLWTAATTDQWQGALVTGVQLAVVAGAAWWGLRR